VGDKNFTRFSAKLPLAAQIPGQIVFGQTCLAGISAHFPQMQVADAGDVTHVRPCLKALGRGMTMMSRRVYVDKKSRAPGDAAVARRPRGRE
jgi:hypothetical protein